MDVLKNRNFLLLVIGRFITNIGDSLYSVAAMWLVYELTNSTFYTGLAGFLTMAPVALQIFIGPLIEKMNLKRILIRTQIFQILFILIIPLAYYFNFINVWIVLIVMPVCVFIEQFSFPAESALLPRLIPKDSIVKANSFMNITYQGSEIMLLEVSGLIIASIGAISVYIINSITFISAAICFSLIKVRNNNNNNNETERENNIKEIMKSYRKDLYEGYSFIKNSFIPRFLFAAIVGNLIIGAVTATLPNYADIRGGGNFYGYYLASMSFGLLIGSILAPLLEKLPLGKLTIFGFLLSGIFWTTSALVVSSKLSIAFFGLALVPIGATNIIFLSTLQSILPQNIVARVFSFIASITSIVAPIGALAGGSLANFIGSDKIFLSGGVVGFIIAGFWLFQPFLRQIPRPSSMDPEIYGLTLTNQDVNL